MEEHFDPNRKKEIRNNLVNVIKSNPINDGEGKTLHYHTFLAILLFMMFIGGGAMVVKSAEESVPESPLYAMKINVIEPLKKGLAISKEEKSDVYINSATERLQESIKLHYIGKLNTGNIAFIQENFNDNALRAVSEINGISDQAIKEEKKDNFKKSLMAKEDTLLSISGQANVLSNVDPLLGEIHKVIKSLSDSLNDKENDLEK